MKPIKLFCLVLSFTAALADSGDASKAEKQSPSLPSKLSPLDTIPDVIFTGENEGSYFSAGLAASGDLNGDGYADIVIGAPNHNNFRGRVYIYFGGKDISSVPDMIFSGETAETRLGQRIALGDVNNDGYDDLLIGGWGYNSRQGRAYLYYGSPSFDGDADKTFEAEAGETTSEFGFNVGLGDVNNDNCADLAIYADNYGGDARGRVYLYYGATGENTDTIYDKTFDAEASGTQRFGRSMKIGQDIDGDNYGDLVIGALGYGNDKGRAYLFYGGDPMDNICDLTFTGENELEMFSRYFDVGDINNDNCADIVIAASKYGIGSSQRGRVYIYYGTDRMDATCELTLQGEAGLTSNFGIGVVVAHLNSDDSKDVLIGSDNYPNVTWQGRLYLYYGDSGTPLDAGCDLTFNGERTGIAFGRHISVGDVDNNGYNDIVVGAWRYNQCQGRAYLYYGGPKK